MKIILDIPKEFEKHFNKDRFKDSLKRIITDVTDEIESDFSISGRYEIELCEMLIEAFKNTEVRKVGHWIGIGNIDMCCSECGNTPDHEPGMTPEATDFCPYCGSEME